jgi:hypothetical protein
MVDQIVTDVSDAELPTALGDLKFEGFEILEVTKQPSGFWNLKIRKSPELQALNPTVSASRPALATVVAPDWMPSCSMERIICHWTAGAYKASDHDRECYHILIEGSGNLVRGEHSIADNVDTRDDDYAAHTRLCNTGSIGISVCCMANAIEAPFNGGPCPMTKQQWEALAQVAAQLAKRYGIKVTSKTILGHGEVQAELAKPQKQKWDPMILPWEPTISKKDVGNRFRARVSELLANS